MEQENVARARRRRILGGRVADVAEDADSNAADVNRAPLFGGARDRVLHRVDRPTQGTSAAGGAFHTEYLVFVCNNSTTVVQSSGRAEGVVDDSFGFPIMTKA